METRIVSALAAKMIAATVRPDVILKYAALFRVDPAAADREALFELWFIASIASTACLYKVRGDRNQYYRWQWCNVEVAELKYPRLSLQKRWNFPQIWHPAGFDAVYWRNSSLHVLADIDEWPDRAVRRRRLMFVILTRDDMHAFAPEPFCEFLTKITTVMRDGEAVSIADAALEMVELYCVTPLVRLDTFRILVTSGEFQRRVVSATFPQLWMEIKCAVRVVGVRSVPQQEPAW